MMEEIRKRPFMRPLFYWVAGIILQVCFPLRQLSCLLLLPVIIAVILSGLSDHKDTCFRYDSRWVYGMAISCLFVFLSVQFTVLAEHRSAKSGDSGWLKERAYRVQEYMVEKLDGLHVSDREKSILATITVNYRKAMNRELRDRFSVTGVAHLLSVSGFHVGIVAALLSVLFSVFPNRFVFRRMKFVLILLFVWMFTYIAGLSAAAVRSALMFTIYVIGLQFQYRPDRYNTWAAAAFCMLVYDPFYLFDVGFQLSFVAVFFILYLQPRFYQLIEVRNPLFAVPWGVLTVTVAAQIGTVFLCAFYFGEISTVFLCTNLFLSLLATLLIPLALFYMLLPAGIPGYGWLQSVVEILTQSMMWVVDRFSRFSGVTFSVRFDLFTLILAYIILGLVLYYIRSKRFRILLFALALFLLLLFRQIILR